MYLDDVTNGCPFAFGLGSGYDRRAPGIRLLTQIGVMLILIRYWESVPPINVGWITCQRTTYHVSSVAKRRSARPLMRPNKIDTTLTCNRHPIDTAPGRLTSPPIIWLPEHIPILPTKLNQTQTDLSPNCMIFVGLRSISRQFGPCDWGIKWDTSTKMWYYKCIFGQVRCCEFHRWGTPPAEGLCNLVS